MRWDSTCFKRNGLYKIEQSAFSIPRLKYRDIHLDDWVRDHAKTLPLIHRIDTVKGHHQYRIESQIALSSIVEDYSKIWDYDYVDTLISADNRRERTVSIGDEIINWDIYVNGKYYCVKYPMLLDQAYKLGAVALHLWNRDSVNAASKQYNPSPVVDLYMDLSIDESWLVKFCGNLESEKYSSAIIDRLYSDINSNFFHLQDIINVATGRSLFTKNFLQYTKFQLYSEVGVENLQFQDPFQAIGTYFRNGQQELISLPLLLLE